MGRYLLARLLSAGLTLAAIMSLTFVLLRQVPGGPFDSDQAWPPEVAAQIAVRYHLDQPVVAQFGYWIRDLARGDLGESFGHPGRAVVEIMSEAFPRSFFLGVCSLVLSILFGVSLAGLAATRPRSWGRVSGWVIASGLSLPSFLSAGILVYVFSLRLGWFPPALWDGVESWVLPVLTLSGRPLALVTQMVQTTLREALGSDYIRVAYGKGCSEARVVFKHALKNSLVPTLAMIGPLASSLVAGSFLVESVFQIPGMGMAFVHSILNRDYPLVMGITLVYGVILIGTQLGIDLLFTWVDPRIRLGARESS